MNKNDLINEIAAAAEITKTAAERALAGLLDAIENGLAAGDSVTLVGFGSFSIKERAARTGRNPQTGKQIDIPAKKVVKFKTGKNLAATLD
jgi:DNA-binding protein HU-beta